MKSDNLRDLMAPMQDQQDDQYNLGRYLDALYDNRKLIAILTVLATLIGIVYVVLAEPVYQSDILIQVEENPNSPSNLLSSVSSMFDVKSDAQDEIEIISSRLVVSRTVDTMKLYIKATPKYFPLVGRWIASFGDESSRPGLFGFGGFAWGPEHADITRFDVPPRMYGKSFEMTALPNGEFRLKLSSADVDATGRIGVPLHVQTKEGPIDLLVRSIAAPTGGGFELTRQSHLATVERLQTALRIKQSSKDSGIIAVSLEGNDPEQTSRTLTEIGSQYVRQNIERKAEEAQKSVQFLDSQIPIVKRQLEDSEEAFNAFRVRNATLNLSDEGAAVLQQTVDAQSRLVDLQQKYDELSARFTANHPAVISIANQMDPVRARLAELEVQTKRLPQIEQAELRLQRDMEVNRDLYTNLLDTAQQLRLLRAGKTGNVRMVDAAVTAELPVKPKRPIVVGLAVLIGLTLGSLLAWVRKELYGGVVHPNEVERSVGLPVYAVVQQSKNQEELHKRIVAKEKGILLLARTNADDPSVESLRSFRTALQFAMLEAKNNVVLISGSSPNGGKSFVAANFAAVVAASNQRVLLVDGDLRKGLLHQHFGRNASPGLSDVIASGVSVDEAIHHDLIPNLDFLSRGNLSPNPSELLMHASLKQIVGSLSERYDLVIVDSPPVLVAADAAELSRMAGCVFLVVRQDVTALGEVRESIKRLVQVGVAPKGVIFNGMKQRPGSYGYGYGRYRYASYTYAPYKE
jgi:tyrosine-protein kinase Etk/Wzc